MVALAHQDPRLGPSSSGALVSDYPMRAGPGGRAADDLPHRRGADDRRPRASDRRRGAGRAPGRAAAGARGRLGDDPAADGGVQGDRDAELRQPGGPASFDDLDREIAERIAERIALALENARIASERSEIAETLQKGLRPPPIPHIPGWSVAALYRPAGTENMIGGDFYDLFRIEDGWMLVIGDVTGHGARAASIAAVARNTLRTAGSMTGSPLDALCQLNRALLAQRGGALCSVAALTLNWPVGTAGRRRRRRPPSAAADFGPARSARSPPEGPVLGAFDDASLGAGEGRVELRRAARRLHRWGDRGPLRPRGASARSACASGCARSGARRRRCGGSTPTWKSSAEATSTTTRRSWR